MKLFRKKKRGVLELEDVDEALWRRYAFLTISQLEHEEHMRKKAIRLSRKYSKNQPWVI